MGVCKLWLGRMVLNAAMELSSLIGMAVGLAVWCCWAWYTTAETRQRYWAVVWENLLYVELAVACVLGLLVAFLWYHTELDPWAGRRRLFLFNDETIKVQARYEAEEVLKSTRLRQLDTKHPVYVRVSGVVSRLLAANSGVDAILDQTWNVVVVDSPIINAIVEPNGLVLVYTGLTTMANDDQLMIVVGHELAHCLLRHANQIGSIKLLIAVLCMAPGNVVIWATLPFCWNLLAHICWTIVLSLCIVFPFIRAYETEADRIGLELAAKACVDVTQGYRFWDAMAAIDSRCKLLWFLSMHPSNTSRSRHLFNWIPAATEIRRQASC
ncbi:hypothetical protein ACI65C_005969 [Semiaphis heraclei]